MGNFSLDPQARADDALAKHYVGVRQQQAVPLLDADWNLLEDLRRAEHETLGQWFIGSGVPAGDDGFGIFPAGVPNDFSIRHGLCLVSGKLTVNDADTRYTTQPNFGNPNLTPPLPPLTAPAANKSFIVYLDVWEREVDSQADPGLIDVRIGVESAIRLKRDWAVRVARIPEDSPVLAAPPVGHVFLPLARLNRTTSNDITAAMIEDLRDTQLSLLRKIEVRDSTGVIIVDNARFRTMLEITRTNVFAFIRYITTQFNPAFSPLSAAETLGLEVAAHIAHTAEAGLANSNALTMANQGALNYLRQLYQAQQSFMQVWRDVVLQLGAPVKKYASYQNFINQLDQRLNQPVVGALTGMLPGLNAGDLAAVTAMQEEIARLIGTAASSIARGTIQVAYSNAPPGNLILGQVVRLQFRVRSFTTLADTCTVSILPAAGWPRVLVDAGGNQIPGNKVSIPASGGEVTLFVDVTVQAGSSQLQLRVVSDSNPAEIDQSSGLITLTVGQPAPLGEDQVQFNIETPFRATIVNGVVNVLRPPNPQPGSIGVRIFNHTGQTATFQLAVAKVAGTEVGTWNAALSEGPVSSVTLADGANAKPGGIDVTTSPDSVSVQLRYTATTTIGGVTFVTERIIAFAAT